MGVCFASPALGSEGNRYPGSSIMEVGIHQDYYMASQIEVGIKVAPLFSTVAGGGGAFIAHI